MGLGRLFKSLWRFLLLVALSVSVCACVVLLLVNWSATVRVEFLVGQWYPPSQAAVLGVGMAAGLIAGLLLSRLPGILAAGKIEKRRREQEQLARDANAWRDHQRQLQAARDTLAAAGKAETPDSQTGDAP